MSMACWGFALMVALSGAPAFAAAAEEEVLEVDLGEAEPTATPVPPTATAAPTQAPTEAPTPEPTATAVAEQTPAAEASPTPAGADLDKVRFDGGEGGEDGLMIIAPGAASPEDSLESFGIDSPFNWKGRDRKTLKPGEAAGDEALELSAPETSDLRERVSVETGEGDKLPSDGDFDEVERSGIVLTAAEYRVDGRVSRSTDGGFVASKGGLVALRMEPGRQIYPGSIYTVFREGGMLRSGGQDPQDTGMLVVNTGVVKVVRIEGEEVLARVERQYESVREGDLVRLRDPERLRYYSSLRQGGTAPLDLKGEVLGMRPPKMVARRGDVVYLNIGRKQGAWPGLRLQLLREPEAIKSDGVLSVRQTGRIGQLEIINVAREGSTARVLRALGEVRVGDKVRFR